MVHRATIFSIITFILSMMTHASFMGDYRLHNKKTSGPLSVMGSFECRDSKIDREATVMGEASLTRCELAKLTVTGDTKVKDVKVHEGEFLGDVDADALTADHLSVVGDLHLKHSTAKQVNINSKETTVLASKVDKIVVECDKPGKRIPVVHVKDSKVGEIVFMQCSGIVHTDNPNIRVENGQINPGGAL